MLELIFVRHGETTSQITNKYIGVTDIPLSERGKRQALSLARTFAREKLDAIYTSPLTRAKETADPIAKMLYLEAQVVSDLCDRNYGIWEGLTMDEIQEKYPNEHDLWYKTWPEYEVPQGESERQVYERNGSALKKILENHDKGKILVVSHQICIRNMLSMLFEMNIDSGWHFQINHAGICRLKIDEYGYATLTSFNEI